MNYNVEHEIDFKKYFIYLLRYWWVGVLLAILCGTAFGSYKYMQDSNEKKKTENTENTAPRQSIEEALSIEERQDVQLAVEYYKQIQLYNEYLKSSSYIAQDPYEVKKTTLYYVLELDNNSIEDYEEKLILLNNMSVAYTTYINEGEFADRLSEKTELDIRDASELVISNVANININDVTLKNYFKVTYYNVGDEDIYEQIESCIEEYKVKVRSSFGEHTLKLADKYTTTSMDFDVLLDQQSIHTNIYNLDNRLVATKKGFSDNQMLYYNNMIAKLNNVETEADGVLDSDNIATSIAKVHVDKKYILVGIAFGILLYCGIMLLKFAFSSYVLAESGFFGMFNLRYLGMLFNNEDANVSLLRKFEYGDALQMAYDELISRIALKIKLVCKKDDVEKIAIIGSALDKISDDKIQDLIKRLKEEGIDAVILESVFSSSEDMSELFQMGRCVFIEQTGTSKIKHIAELVGLCKENAIDMYGVVDICGWE